MFLGRMLDQAEDKLPRVTEVYAAFASAKPNNYLAPFLYAKALSLEVAAIRSRWRRCCANPSR